MTDSSAKTGGNAGACELRDEQVAQAYDAGRADERAAVMAYLRRYQESVALDIERGEHVGAAGGKLSPHEAHPPRLGGRARNIRAGRAVAPRERVHRCWQSMQAWLLLVSWIELGHSTSCAQDDFSRALGWC